MVAIGTDAAIPKVKADGTNFRAALIAARQVLNQRKVPAANRTFAVGSNMEAAALNDVLLQRVNESGSSDVLRDATIGQLFASRSSRTRPCPPTSASATTRTRSPT